MSTFEEEMRGFEEEWTSAQENAGTGGGMLPDGDYQAKIIESRVEMSDWDEWQLYLKYEDLGGAGEIRSWDSLQHEVGRSIAAERTKRLGYDGTLADLEAAVVAGDFIDLVVDIRVKTKKGDTRDFKQVYVNRCYGKAGDGGVPEPSAPVDDEDIPF
jgi:hypothetical protein